MRTYIDIVSKTMNKMVMRTTGILILVATTLTGIGECYIVWIKGVSQPTNEPLIGHPANFLRYTDADDKQSLVKIKLINDVPEGIDDTFRGEFSISPTNLDMINTCKDKIGYTLYHKGEETLATISGAGGLGKLILTLHTGKPDDELLEVRMDDPNLVRGNSILRYLSYEKVAKEVKALKETLVGKTAEAETAAGKVDTAIANMNTKIKDEVTALKNDTIAGAKAGVVREVLMELGNDEVFSTKMKTEFKAQVDNLKVSVETSVKKSTLAATKNDIAKQVRTELAKDDNIKEWKEFKESYDKLKILVYVLLAVVGFLVFVLLIGMAHVCYHASKQKKPYPQDQRPRRRINGKLGGPGKKKPHEPRHPDNRPRQDPRPENRPQRPENHPQQKRRPENRPEQKPRPENRPKQKSRSKNRPEQKPRPDNRPRQRPRPKGKSGKRRNGRRS